MCSMQLGLFFVQSENFTIIFIINRTIIDNINHKTVYEGLWTKRHKSLNKELGGLFSENYYKLHHNHKPLKNFNSTITHQIAFKTPYKNYYNCHWKLHHMHTNNIISTTTHQVAFEKYMVVLYYSTIYGCFYSILWWLLLSLNLVVIQNVFTLYSVACFFAVCSSNSYLGFQFLF